MKLLEVTAKQKNTIHGKPVCKGIDNVRFNVVESNDGRYGISKNEASNCNIDEYKFVKALKEFEFIPPEYDDD